MLFSSYLKVMVPVLICPATKYEKVQRKTPPFLRRGKSLSTGYIRTYLSLSLYTLIQSISMADGRPLSEASFFRLEEKLIYISS